ncbi:SIS domain-containing protein [Candidatus Nomurabacteria bacterium]|nr:SIS domain-containing protein [Candidatus Nomurabacteria bacterium]
MNEIINRSLLEALNTLQEFINNSDNAERIEQAASLMFGCLLKGNKILSCGNGGSLCDATHFAEELTGRYRLNRKPLAAIAMNDPAYLTCVGNDFSFEDTFSRYVEAIGNRNDVLLAISTSGNSENVVRCASKAKLMGMKVVALTREGDNLLKQVSDVTIASPETPFSDRIQEIHIKVIHILIQLIENKMGY